MTEPGDGGLEDDRSAVDDHKLVHRNGRTRGQPARLPDPWVHLAAREVRQVGEHLRRVSHERLDEVRLTQPVQLLG